MINELSNYIVEAFLKETLDGSRNVVVFAGRFQPFHKGHYKAYQHLVEKFGADNVYISTSNKVDSVNSPFTFEQKKRIMCDLYDIPSDKIIESKQPYKPDLLLNEMDGNINSYTIAVGHKDGNRFSGKYYTEYNDGGELKPYSKTTYKYNIPTQEYGINATEVRRRIREAKRPTQKLFKELGFKNYNSDTVNVVFDVLKNTPEITNESVYIPKKIINRWLSENKHVIKEASIIGGRLEVDDGPNFFYANSDVFKRVSTDRAKQIGYTVVQQILDRETSDIQDYREYPNGPVGSVTMFQAGIYDELTPNSQIELESDDAYSAWKKHIKRVVGKYGYSLIGFVDNEFVDDNEEIQTHEINENLTFSDVRFVDSYADREFAPVDFDLYNRHFFERLNDPRNKKPITQGELIKFIDGLSRNKDKFLSFLKKYKEIVATDVRTNINIPFMMLANKVIAKTVMRKPKFMTSNPTLKFEGLDDKDKLDYYIEYYTNLSPSGFRVSTDGKSIIIGMGSNKLNEERDYKKEYENYQGKPEQIKRRVGRNAARRKMERLGKVKKGDGKDVHHKNGDPTDNRLSNLEVLPRSENRAMNNSTNKKGKKAKKSKNEYAMYTGHTAYPADNIGLRQDDIEEGLMIGYPDQAWLDAHDKRLKKLRKQFDAEKNNEYNYYTLREGVEKVNIPIPSDIKAIYNAFKREGQKLYIVGGAVRDALLGMKPKDYDLATNLPPDDVIAIANKYGLPVVELGKEFGVVVVNGSEIATFRRDVGAGRRPDSVEFTDIEGDVKRRDLTINALFYDIDRKEVVDLVGGIDDIRKKRVKTVGAATDRFAEDPLRKLRILRFANRFSSSIDRDDYNALMQNPSLSGVSAERIKDEFFKTIKSSKDGNIYYQQLLDLGMLYEVFPSAMFKTKTNKMIANNNPLFFVAYLFRGSDGRYVEKYLNKIKYTVDEVRNIKLLLELYDFTPIDIVSVKKLMGVSSLSNADIIEWGKHIGKNFSKLIKFKLSVSGNDVMALGFKGKDIQDQIRKIEAEKFMNESVVTKSGVTITKFRDLFDIMPVELQKRVYGLKNVPQNLKWHPEGNTLKHTIVVVSRALTSGDIDLAIAAIMHDIGKDETIAYHPKTGMPTAHGHEKVSAKLVRKYSEWIVQVGGNVANVFYIVKNHMRYKKFDEMRPYKQQSLSSFRAFDKLKQFSTYDRGGLHVEDYPQTDLDGVLEGSGTVTSNSPSGPDFFPSGITYELNKTKPDPWLDTLGFTQVNFPKSDHIYGKAEDEKDVHSVIKKAKFKVTDKRKQSFIDDLSDNPAKLLKKKV